MTEKKLLEMPLMLQSGHLKAGQLATVSTVNVKEPSFLSKQESTTFINNSVKEEGGEGREISL